MKRSLLFLLLIFFGCKTEEEKPIATTQEEVVIPSPKEVPQPDEKQVTPQIRKKVTTHAQPSAKPKEEVVKKEEPTPEPKQEEREEPTEEVQKALNRTVFEESFGWQAMHAIPVEAPPKHPDSLKWEDISGGYAAYLPPPTPWWVTWLAYINMAAAIILCGYLLITNG